MSRCIIAGAKNGHLSRRGKFIDGDSEAGEPTSAHMGPMGLLFLRDARMPMSWGQGQGPELWEWCTRTGWKEKGHPVAVSSVAVTEGGKSLKPKTSGWDKTKKVSHLLVPPWFQRILLRAVSGRKW